MKFKKSLPIICLIIFLFAIASVSASEVNDTAMASEDIGEMELSVSSDMETDNLKTSPEDTPLTQTDNEEIIGTEDDGTFEALFNKINNTAEGSTVKLENDYRYEGIGYADGIVISKSNIIIDGQGHMIDAQNQARIFLVQAENVTVKNITFTNAHTAGNGSAIYWNSSSGCRVSDCNFVNNSADGDCGAIYLFYSDHANISGCSFVNNSAGVDGGAIACEGSVWSSVSGCTFVHNSAGDEGGAIAWWGDNGSFSDCSFENNSADSNGGAIFLIYSDYGSVSGCSFVNNSADIDGGAISWLGDNGNFSGCSFTHNFAGADGGAIAYEDGVEGTVSGCSFANNLAGDDGAAIAWGGSYGSVFDCDFVNNSADSNGGAIYWVYSEESGVSGCSFENNSAGENGGAIMCYHCKCTADTCIFKTSSDTTYNTDILSPTLNVNDFTSTYNSGEKLTFELKTSIGETVSDANITIEVYKNNTLFGTYHCLSGDGWVVDLPVGSYNAVYKTEFEGCAPVNRTITITVVTTNIICQPITTVYNSEDYLVATLKDGNGNAVRGVNLTVSLNGVENYTTDLNGTIKIPIRGLSANNYTAQITFTGTDNYIGSNANVNVTINKATPNIEVFASDVTYPNDIVVNVKSDVNGSFVLKIGDKEIPVNLVAGETKDITVSNLAANETGYGINVTYEGNENYTATYNDTVSVKVSKAVPIINVSSSDVTYPDKVVVNVVASVSGDYVVSVGGKSVPVSLVAGELKSVEFELAASDVAYGINVTYEGNENYTGAYNDTVSVKVSKGVPVINVSGSDVTYPDKVVVNVVASVSGVYVVSVGGKSVPVSLVAGELNSVEFELATNEAGYGINVTYEGNENYTAAYNDAVTVKVKKGTIKLTAPKVTTTYKVNKNLVITLKDSKGKALSGVKVTVKLKGTKTYTTDKNGQIKINVANLVPKTYTAKVTFEGNANYVKSFADVKVTVKKAKPKIIAKKKTYKAKVKTKKFKITLKDNKGKPIKKAKVRLIVKKIKKNAKKKTAESKKKYKKNIAKTNKKGKATFKVQRNKKGKYQATVKFYGNKYYTKAVKKVKIKMK